MKRFRFSLCDFLITLAVLGAACLLLWSPWSDRQTGGVLTVTTPDASVSYPLSVDRTFTVSSNGITLTVEIRDGAAFVSDSDCPDGVCRHSGKISENGETILCAPAGITLTVGGGDGVDFIAG